jgi:hypothetical protein
MEQLSTTGTIHRHNDKSPFALAEASGPRISIEHQVRTTRIELSFATPIMTAPPAVGLIPK